MRFSAIHLLLLPALVRAQTMTQTAPAAPEISSASPPSILPSNQTVAAIASPTPEPTAAPIIPPEKLELRGVVDNIGGAATIPTQMNPMTTMWQATVVKGVTTYVEVIFSQTFASVPIQGPTPLEGKVGMGTLTGTVGAVKTKATSGADALNARGWKGAAGMAALAGGAAYII